VKLYKRAEHVILGAYTPAVIKKTVQAVQALDRPDKEDESFLFTPLGIAVSMAAPFRPRDHEVDKFVARALRGVSNASRQHWIITSKLTSPQAMAPGEATRLINERTEAQVKNQALAYRYMKAAKGYSMTPRQIMVAADEADMNRGSAQLAMQGMAAIKPLSPETLRKIKEVDPRRYAEVMKATRQQPKRVNLQKQ
jgi:hypothetical protein